MTLAILWWAILVIALAAGAWAVLATGGLAPWIAAAACAATAMSATLALRGAPGRPGFLLLYVGFALGLASLLVALFRKRPGAAPGIAAGAWAILVPLLLPYLP